MIVMMIVMMMSSCSPRPLSNQIHNNSISENQTFAIQALGLCTLCESNGEQYWEFPVFARSEDSQGSARIKASKGFSKLDLQNNSPTKSGQEDKVISIYIMMLVMMMMTMMVMTMMMLMMMVSGVGWSGSKSCSSPIRPSTWTNVSKSSGDHDDDDDDNGGGDADDNGVGDQDRTAVRR